MATLLHSVIQGKGQPLIILHGFLGMLDNWKTLGNLFAEHGFEVHLIDQRNHGKSFHSENFNYQLLVDDLKHYTTFYNLKNICILGHSMGGKTAMKFACQNPSITKKLLVADISPKYYPPHHQTILEGLQAIPLDTLETRKEADTILKNYISEIGIRQFLLKNLYRKDKNNFSFRFNLKALIDNINYIGEALLPKEKYSGATLFLRGSHSNYILDEDFYLINNHFSNAEIQTIPDTGHWLHAENPKVFFDKAVIFLN